METITVRYRAHLDLQTNKILNLGGAKKAIPDLGQFLDTVANIGANGRLVAAQVPLALDGLVYDAARGGYLVSDQALDFTPDGGGVDPYYTDKKVNPGTGKLEAAPGYNTYVAVARTSQPYTSNISLYNAYYSYDTSYLAPWAKGPGGSPTSGLASTSPAAGNNATCFLWVSVAPADLAKLRVTPNNKYDDSATLTRLTALEASRLTKANNLSDLADKAAARKNLGVTDGNDKVPASLLPSYVDDIVEFDGGRSAFPAPGERGIQYVDTSNGGYVQYRWSGTQYGVIVASPGTTDAVVEGTTNKYFTELRAIGSLLAGYAKASAARAILATDNVLTALGILEYKADANRAAISTVVGLIPAGATPTNQLVTQQDLSLASGGPLIVAFTNQLAVTIQHNRNRLVGVQIYENDGIQSDALVQQLDLNNVQISFGGTAGLSGNIILF